MMLIDSSTFFEITKNFEIVPYTQSKGMYDFCALSGSERIHFYINNAENPTMALFGHEKKMLNKKMLQIEGECYALKSDFNIATIREFYSQIILLGYDMIEVCSNRKYHFDYEIAMRQTGFLRPVGQFSMPITKIIDLTSEIRYGSNWKRNFRKANHHELKFEVVDKIQWSDCEDFVSINEQMLERKSIRSRLTVKQVFEMCNSGNFFLYFVSISNVRIATLITHQNKTHSGSLYSASNKEALRTSASFFMYKELFCHLRNTNIVTFDVEKLVPSTDGVNNVFIFKDGVDGKHIVLNGEWSWYKKSYYRPLMYFIKKHLMKKREL